MKRIFFIFLVCLFSVSSFAQRWKIYRYEVSAGIGATNFLGELGGANQIGTNYFKDLELVETRPAINVGVRYKLSPYTAIKTTLTYGMVAGDDKLTEEEYRNYRNLSFRSSIIELASNFEAAFMKEQVAHRYRIKGVKGQRAFEMFTYGFVGISVFYFNPKANYNGHWFALRPLGTEGQGLAPTRKKYSLVQLAIPVGLGFKYTIGRRMGLGLEYGIRKTFTDYIDDVSRTYYDNMEIKSANGPAAAALADRSDLSRPDLTKPGAQRGDPRDKDSFMFLVFSINYKLRTGRDNLPKF